jgi:hypothetical protein
MNILHIEEMAETETALLLEHSHEKYRINLPDAEDVALIDSYSSHFLTTTNPAVQQIV